MSLRKWVRYTALAAVITVTGCNLFNPSGEGDGGNTNPRAEGEEYFRQGQYAKAMTAFEKAIAQDSTNSMAYYGYAKAAVFLYKLDRLGIFDDLQATKDNPETFAFLQHSDSLLTLRMQAASKVRRVLSILTERDSLTRLWRYTVDSTSDEALADTNFAERRDFITSYLNAQDTKLPLSSRRRAKFPLTDFRMPAKNVAVDYTAFELLYTITRLYDLDQNDTIDARDALMKKLTFGSGSGGFGIDSLANIAGDLENDTATTQNLNALIAGMQSGLLTTSSLASLIAPPTSEGDSSGASQQTNQNVDSVISSLGDAVLFYQFGDKLDNDGDGCVDEEIMDGKDNDLDGYVDEDARVIPPNKPDFVDNDLDGKKDPFLPPLLLGTDTSGREDTTGTTKYALRPYVLGFVYAYLDTAKVQNSSPVRYEKGEGEVSNTSWVKIKQGALGDQLKLRLDIQKDSLVTKMVNGRLPNAYASKLQNARDVVGGCWRHIKTESEP
jgi:tetratricopeptide (TPR) repeat protein